MPTLSTSQDPSGPAITSLAPTSLTPTPRVPLWLKVTYTAFLAVLVPVYWYNYGPTNFLYFCDIALFVTLIGIWRESALLVSMAAVGLEAAVVRVAVQRLLGRLLQRVHRVQQEPDRLL